MKKKINFGILGLGRVFDKSVCDIFLNKLKNSNIVSVYDKNIKKKKKFEKIFNTVPVKSIYEFLEKKYDYIYIATESGNHYKNILDCFKYGHNVIVEKPPVLKINELEELDKISKSKALEFFVVYQNRLNLSVNYLKNKFTNLVNKNNRVIFVSLDLLWSRNKSYYSDWHGKWKMDGGVLAQQGIHYIDLLCYLLGNPVKCISLISNKSNKIQAEDTHSALILFKNNISCTVNLTTAIKPNDIEATIKIYTQNNLIKLSGLCCNKLNIYKNNKSIEIKKIYEKVPNGYGISHKKVFQNLINYNLGFEKKKPLKAIDTLVTLKLVNMLYKSYEKKKWVYYNQKSITSKLGY